MTTPRLKAIAEAFAFADLAREALEGFAQVTKKTVPSVRVSAHILAGSSAEAFHLACIVTEKAGSNDEVVPDRVTADAVFYVVGGVTISGRLSAEEKARIKQAEDEIAATRLAAFEGGEQ